MTQFLLLNDRELDGIFFISSSQHTCNIQVVIEAGYSELMVLIVY